MLLLQLLSTCFQAGLHAAAAAAAVVADVAAVTSSMGEQAIHWRAWLLDLATNNL